jgi:3-methyl-2-oxobutanoate hydroxymethyltransferase
VSDILGIFESWIPKFEKKYANISETMLQVFEDYIRDVREENFPGLEHCSKMKAGEAEKSEKLLK